VDASSTTSRSQSRWLCERTLSMERYTVAAPL
jgi:hypothetical protein